MPEIKLPTDEELQHWEFVAKTLSTRTGHDAVRAVAERDLLDAIPRLLHLIRMERQDEDVYRRASQNASTTISQQAASLTAAWIERDELRAEVKRLTEVNQRIATSHANLTRDLQARLDEGLAPLTKRIETVRAYVNDPMSSFRLGDSLLVPVNAVLRILDGE